MTTRQQNQLLNCFPIYTQDNKHTHPYKGGAICCVGIYGVFNRIETYRDFTDSYMRLIIKTDFYRCIDNLKTKQQRVVGMIRGFCNLVKFHSLIELKPVISKSIKFYKQINLMLCLLRVFLCPQKVN